MSEEIKDVVMTDELAAKADAIMGTIMHTDEDPVVSTKKLLEHGAHFGHQTRKWNPKMNKYIFGSKNGVHIIDLTLTASKLQEAYLALKKIVADGGKVLFVGTKPQVKEVIKEEALRSGSFYVVNRWLGGTLTNFKTIQKRIRYLNDLKTMEEDGSFDNMPKKEAVLLRKEKEKAEKDEKEFKDKFSFDGGTPTTIFFKDGEEKTTATRIEGDISIERTIDKFKKNGFIK